MERKATPALECVRVSTQLMKIERFKHALALRAAMDRNKLPGRNRADRSGEKQKLNAVSGRGRDRCAAFNRKERPGSLFKIQCDSALRPH